MLGGILGQKVAETLALAGLVLIDSSISREVSARVPYSEVVDISTAIIVPAPVRDEQSIDESADDIAFQKKYLTMESSKALTAFSFPLGAKEGIYVNSELIACPCLVLRAVNNSDDDKRGRATAEQLYAEYTGIPNASHTGLLVGQRHMDAVERIMEWLKRF